jgi:superfamily II DNA/RNA helicase
MLNIYHLNQRSEVVLKLLDKSCKDINQNQTIVFSQTKQECDLLARS